MVRFPEAECPGLFKKLLSINIQSTVVLIIGVVAAALAVIAGFAIGTIGVIIGISLGAIVLIITVLLSSMIRLAAYKTVDEEHGAKNAVSAFSVVRSRAAQVVLLWILQLIILIVLASPFIVLGIAIWTMWKPALATPIIELGFILSGLIVGFFLQFSIYELIIGGKGLLDSVKSSYSSVRGNIIESIIMYCIRVALESLIRVPFILVCYGAVFVGTLVSLAGAIALSALLPVLSVVAIGIGVVVGALLFFAFLLAYITTEDTIMIPLEYSYWKRLASKPPAAPPIIRPSRRWPSSQPRSAQLPKGNKYERRYISRFFLCLITSICTGRNGSPSA